LCPTPRRIGLAETIFASATGGSICLKLLKIESAGAHSRPPLQNCHGVGLAGCRRMGPGRASLEPGRQGTRGTPPTTVAAARHNAASQPNRRDPTKPNRSSVRGATIPHDTGSNHRQKQITR